MAEVKLCILYGHSLVTINYFLCNIINTCLDIYYTYTSVSYFIWYVVRIKNMKIEFPCKKCLTIQVLEGIIKDQCHTDYTTSVCAVWPVFTDECLIFVFHIYNVLKVLYTSLALLTFKLWEKVFIMTTECAQSRREDFNILFSESVILVTVVARKYYHIDMPILF